MILDLDIIKIMLSAEYNKDFKELTKDIIFNPIVSYTTRPKRESETEGIEHYFISNEEADNLLANNDTLAYTKIGDNRYFSLYNQLKSQNVYIIDPSGIEDLNYRYPEMEKCIIYIYSNYTNRMNRYTNRSSECTVIDFEKRNAAENDQFNRFESNITSISNIYKITNNSPYIITTMMTVSKHIIDTYKPNILYCIVGRTSSGKDTIVRNLVKLFDKKEVEL